MFVDHERGVIVRSKANDLTSLNFVKSSVGEGAPFESASAFRKLLSMMLVDISLEDM